MKDDVIYRQAAIDVLKRDEALVRAFGYQHAIDEIQALPSAEPVRHERWIYICNSSVNGLKICECTGCHRRTYGSLDFCGNCGAKMDEEATDEQTVSD